MTRHDEVLELSESLNRTLGIIDKLLDAVTLLSKRVNNLEAKQRA
jgi:hypothetical protein